MSAPNADSVLHRESCGCTFAAIDVPDDQGYGQGWRPVEQCIKHARTCPDGGRCWHLCGEGPCWRVANCAPLSAYGDDWTDADKAAQIDGSVRHD